MSTPFYDLASLVLVPSGYKASKVYAQKPLTTDGQLTFSRSTGATRVASNGLIEKVRTNLALQSNTFSSASWTKFGGVTVTSGQAGYDGTNNAWLITKPAAGFTGVGQAHSNTGVITGSFYLKAGTLTKATVRLIGTPDVNVIFDLANGVIFGGTSTGWLARTITSVGNGWYRCSLALNATASSTFIVYPDEITNTTAGTIFAQNAQLETGDIATQPILTTSAAVSVGPVANVPRLDYLNSSCPRLLLEPQRTNLVPYSEVWQDASAWIVSGTAAIVNNYGSSPDGYNNSTKITGNSGSDFVYDVISVTNATQYTYSFYVKNIDATSTGFWQLIGTTNGVIIWNGSEISSVTGTNINYEAFGTDGWYRVWSTNISAGTSFVNRFYPSLNGGGKGVEVYGFQLEAGAYATSYIPTLGAAVTRGADAASKTGISSLIGQTEGTVFVEGTIVANDSGTNRRIISISDTTTLNQIHIFNRLNTSKLECDGNVSGVTQFSFQSSDIGFNTTFKAAIAYKENDIAFYVNGTLIGTDTSASIPATSRLAFSRGDLLFPHEGNINQALLFKTRLTNAQLAELTQL